MAEWLSISCAPFLLIEFERESQDIRANLWVLTRSSSSKNTSPYMFTSVTLLPVTPHWISYLDLASHHATLQNERKQSAMTREIAKDLGDLPWYISLIRPWVLSFSGYIDIISAFKTNSQGVLHESPTGCSADQVAIARLSVVLPRKPAEIAQIPPTMLWASISDHRAVSLSPSEQPWIYRQRDRRCSLLTKTLALRLTQRQTDKIRVRVWACEAQDGLLISGKTLPVWDFRDGNCSAVSEGLRSNSAGRSIGRQNGRHEETLLSDAEIGDKHQKEMDEELKCKEDSISPTLAISTPKDK